MKLDHTSYISENNMIKILGIMISIYRIEMRVESSANRYFSTNPMSPELLLPIAKTTSLSG